MTNQLVVIKTIENSKIIDESDEKRVINEILILKKIRHPYVIQLYDVDNKFKSDIISNI